MTTESETYDNQTNSSMLIASTHKPNPQS